MAGQNNLALLFHETAAANLDRLALYLGPDESYTYEELDRLANRAGRRFADLGIGSGDVVCLSGDKSIAAFVGLLAALKLGATYSILDPASPPARLRRVLESSGAALYVCPRSSHEVVAKLGLSVEPRLLDNATPDFLEGLGAYSADVLDSTGISPEQSAYIMYTSGSTGMPKGAVMSHDNVTHLIRWSRSAFGFAPGEVLTNVNPLYFDNSVFDIYSSLFTGAALAPFSHATVTHPLALLEAIDDAACTSWFSVPSLLMFLDTLKAFTRENALSTVRRIIFGGEGYPLARLERLFERFGGQAELYNVYGPTECTCIASSYRISETDFKESSGLPPLGSLLPSYEQVIRSADGAAVGAGEPGELCLLGPQVGLGYHQDPERTEQAFSWHVGNGGRKQRMYCTGDLVRWNPGDGKLYFLGRVDNQIKHMGYRIELEEIEAALCTHPDIAEAVALHRSGSGRSEIIAVLACVDRRPAPDEVKIHLAEYLPTYMVPSRYYLEQALPKNRNGKTDRVLLRQKYGSSTSESEL